MSHQIRFLESLTIIPGIAITKDTNSTFTGMTERCAKLLGWKTTTDCLGKTDFDLPCDASKSAQEFIKMDKATIASGEPFLSLEIQHYGLGYKLFLVERQLIQDHQDTPKGVFIYCNDLTKTHLFKSYISLYQFDKKKFDYEFKPACYTLTQNHLTLPLTEKQQNCLFLLVRGKSIKQIAKYFKVSPRTIEGHISAIGKKINCYSKADIIEKAIDSGFLYYLPIFFQSDKLDKIF